MKSLTMVLVFALGSVMCCPGFLFAQVNPQGRSAKEAAASDVQLIAANIEYNKGAMYLAQEAVKRGGDARVKELANKMIEDHSGMLYAMEQLRAAGAGSNGNEVSSGNAVNQVSAINNNLAALKSESFDTAWVANMLVMQQAKLDELTQAREIVTNTQLKTAISESLPLLKKQVAELKSLQKYFTRLAIQERKEKEAKAKAKK